MLAAVDSFFVAAFLAMCLVDQGLVVIRRQNFVRGGLDSAARPAPQGQSVSTERIDAIPPGTMPENHRNQRGFRAEPSQEQSILCFSIFR